MVALRIAETRFGRMANMKSLYLRGETEKAREGLVMGILLDHSIQSIVSLT